MVIDTIILDWSGVISDDLSPVYAACMEIFDHFTTERITLEQFKRRMKNPYYLFWRENVPHANMQEVQKIFNEKMIDSLHPPLPKAKETLGYLYDKGIEIYALSSHPQHLLVQEAKRYGVIDYFKQIYGGKMDKDRTLAGLLSNGLIRRESTIFAEDMVEGLFAGKKNGIITAGILSGYHEREKLEQAKPDYIFKDISGLKTLFT